MRAIMATLLEIFFNFALSPRSIFRRSSHRSLGFTFPRSCPSMESMCFITYNLKSSWVKFKDLICFIYHSYFVGFKLLACFCSQNLFKLFQIHPVFACKALDVAYLLSVRHIKTIPTSNAILAFTWKSSDFSISLKTIICFKRILYSI